MPDPDKKPGGQSGTTRTRTPQQLERQEKAFHYSVVDGKTYREIALLLGCDKDTVTKDIRAEQERRSEEIAERREVEKARAVAFYERVIGKAMVKSDILDGLLLTPGSKVNDHSLEAAIKARERIDKVLGIDAPTKIDLGVQTLLDALDGK